MGRPKKSKQSRKNNLTHARKFRHPGPTQVLTRAESELDVLLLSSSDSEIEVLGYYHDDTPMPVQPTTHCDSDSEAEEISQWKPKDGVSHTLESDGFWSDAWSSLDQEDAVTDSEVPPELELEDEDSEDEEGMITRLQQSVEHDVHVLEHWSAAPIG